MEGNMVFVWFGVVMLVVPFSARAFMYKAKGVSAIRGIVNEGYILFPSWIFCVNLIIGALLIKPTDNLLPPLMYTFAATVAAAVVVVMTIAEYINHLCDENDGVS